MGALFAALRPLPGASLALQPDQPSDAFLLEAESFATGLARDAGRLLMGYFRRPLDIDYKSQGQRSPVTNADKAAEDFLGKAILDRYPTHAILGEEGSGKDSPPTDFTWAVDPLDGTTNFLNGLPVFGSAIGLLWRGQPVVGAIFLPWPGQDDGFLFHARNGGGTFIGDDPIRVAPQAEPKPTGLVAMPAAFRRMFRIPPKMRSRMGEFRGSGSIAYEMAMVACGTMQYALFTGPRVWDVAAGVVLVREAGGTVLELRSRRWTPLHQFGAAPVPGQEELRNWRVPELVGNRQLLDFVTGALKPRPHFLLRRFLRNIRQRRGAAR